jgi:5'-methylthioadenosine phosphorylase
MSPTTTPTAALGVIGGSGFYRFLDDVTEIELNTPFGEPSGPVAIGTVADRPVAFLARHGEGHRFPPHKVNFRANIWALQSVGVTRLFGPCAAGSLRPTIHPGDFVVCDQLIDRSTGRASTFYDGPVIHHATFADPYCPDLRATALAATRAEGVTAHDGGTVVVIPGPRFSSRAESRWYSGQGWDVVNMTQAPEAGLAREAGICYATMALVTDYDSGLEDDPSVPAVTQTEVFAFFEANVERVRAVLLRALADVPTDRTCDCVSGAGPEIEATVPA